MNIRFESSPAETVAMNTEAIRSNFLIENLMVPDAVNLTYTHYDRMIVGGIMPVNNTLKLPEINELKADYFLERREIGIINVGGQGSVVADEKTFSLSKLDCLYLGKGTKQVSFKSEVNSNPALYFIISVPAHAKYENTLCTKEQATPVAMGSQETGNKRTIYKYIHLNGIKSCQLVMGLTVLDSGSVWNSVPPHTHTRRTEVYFYFDIPDGQRLFHFMGQPRQTRHLVMQNNEAVISPPWSVHFGCGTMNYGFIWAMAGENQEFTDMDAAPVDTLL
ncbi:MAG: 5-dehydro-4-deoxy-D-glucuronate isomerase [Bacteroidetes bacterium]|nr:5-dehydro-4-deoxy-D-glucuronate isomerase [Bacteroidota bacterium]MBS1758004.1 5-dehydro-4-deoxy-D-glucuronate isomerase [Bacteroidota bacterium]